MTKCQKEEKWFCKTQKHELQLLPAAGGFHKNELELFWRIGPDALLHLPMPPGYPPFLHCHLIFYFFSIFCVQYISVSLPATYTHSLQHIQFGFACCQNATLSSFFVRSVLILSQVATLSSGFSRPHLTSSILTNSQARTSRSGFPAITSDISLLNIQKPDTHIRLCRPASLNHQPFPQTPSAISRCLRATSFPRHFAAAFYFSNIPFFLFSFFYSFSFSLFFLLPFFSFSFFLSFFCPFPFPFFLLFIFSLHFLFSRLFLSSFLFSFSYPLFPFSFFLFLSPCTFFVCTIPKAAKQNVVL